MVGLQALSAGGNSSHFRKKEKKNLNKIGF